ncbi:MAG: hypothetical protein DPW16_07850 [Chloroflexi bacterium]|nr:hypothetical protein [Chloroflexota bacterium]
MNSNLLRKLLAVIRTILLFLGGITLCMSLYLAVLMVIGQTSLSKDHPDLSTFESLPFRVLTFAIGTLILVWLIARPKLQDSELVPTFAQDKYINEKGEEIFIIGQRESLYTSGAHFREEGVQVVQFFFTVGLIGLSLSLMIAAFTKPIAGLIGFMGFIGLVLTGYILGSSVSSDTNKSRGSDQENK